MIKINMKSLLARFYFHEKPSDRYDCSEGVDICKFRRVCFITGPLKYLLLTIMAGTAFWWLFVMPWFLMGWIYGLVILAAFSVLAIVYGTCMSIAYISDRPTVKETWKSFKEKYCAKVEFVNE